MKCGTRSMFPSTARVSAARSVRSTSLSVLQKNKKKITEEERRTRKARSYSQCRVARSRSALVKYELYSRSVNRIGIFSAKYRKCVMMLGTSQQEHEVGHEGIHPADLAPMSISDVVSPVYWHIDAPTCTIYPKVLSLYEVELVVRRTRAPWVHPSTKESSHVRGPERGNDTFDPRVVILVALNLADGDD